MAVGPWIGLGVAYGLSVRSLLRQRREDRIERPKLRLVASRPGFPVETPTLATLGDG